MQFQYQPLDGPLRIRLLSFNPPTDPPGPTSVQLHDVDLDSTSCPAYWGLSYTWGNPLPSHSPAASSSTQYEILVNGQPFSVGQNLYEFLTRFRGKRHYWIDAICINQEDISERNAQVGIMVEIYSRAEGTFIWLGEHDASSRKAFGMITKFGNARVKLGKEYSEKILGQNWKFNDSAFFDAMGIEAWSEEDWKALSDFYARSWFRRQWVVQEVVLPKQAVVFCGDNGMDWIHFISFTRLYLATRDWNIGLTNLESEFHKAGDSTTIESTIDFVALSNVETKGPTKDEILLKIGSGFRSSSERFDAFLLHTVHRLRGREATLPADHVYAPLSLVRRWKTDVDSLPPIDYGLSVIQIYTNFSSHLMRMPRPMVLSFREDDTDRRLKELPSWVPDYSVRGHIGTPLGIQRSFNASGRHFPQFDKNTYIIRENRLHMKGVLVDTISEITDQIQPHASPASVFDLLQLAFKQDPFLTGHTHLESLMRTLCAGIVEDNKSCPRDDIFEWFARWFRLVSRCPTDLAKFRELFPEVDSQEWGKFWTFGPNYLDNKTLLPPPPNEDNAVSTEVETWLNSPLLHEWLKIFLRHHSRLALTRNRRALAVTKLSAEPGDEVWILFNGRIPYILRKIEGEEKGYHFLGEAYVHGFMEGEIFSRDKVNGLDVTIDSVILI